MDQRRHGTAFRARLAFRAHPAWVGPITWAVVACAALAPADSLAQPSGNEGSDAILVLAAASLGEVLPGIARRWTRETGVPVDFSFDATSRLAHQAMETGRADVFVSADAVWMDWVEERKGILPGSRTTLAGNALVVVVPAGSPGSPGPHPSTWEGVTRIALAGENVPAGRYAQEALEALGLWNTLAEKTVRAGSVRSALEWVATEEAQAGVVYATDLPISEGVREAWTIPQDAHAAVTYTGAILAESARAPLAEDFLAFAAGPEGRRLFAAAGFLPPPEPDSQAIRQAPPEQRPSVASAVRISLLVALAATLAGLGPAIFLGWILARHEFRGKSILTTAVLIPLVLPPVVTGFLLLSLLGTQGVLGGWMHALGIDLPFTLPAAVLAALVVGLPLYVVAIRGAFEAVDPHYEELSWTLGSPPAATFRRITLPLALPGIVAGAVLAFARALGEFGATVVLAGNVEGETRTIALAVYSLLESPGGRETTWLLVTASVALSVGALLGYEGLLRRQRRRMEHRT